MTKAVADKAETDWTKELRDGEIGKDGGTEFVYLKGLRRLAKLKGIKSERHPFVNVVVLKKPDGSEYPFVQSSYEIEFKDGTTFSDVADAHTYNLDGIFRAYPSCMSANRAEARALRKALGINMVSKEELGGNDESVGAMSNEITSAQERVIKKLCKDKGIDNLMDALKLCTTREGVVDLSELTFIEAKAGIKALNKKKAKAK